MSRGSRFLSPTLTALALIVVRMGHQQDKTTPANVQSVKSTMREIYEVWYSIWKFI
jgi:hypothetical protein